MPDTLADEAEVVGEVREVDEVKEELMEALAGEIIDLVKEDKEVRIEEYQDD